MQTRDADIGDAHDIRAHRFQRYRGFIGDRQIGRAGAYHADGSGQCGSFAPIIYANDARRFVPLRIGQRFANGFELCEIGARRQHCRARIIKMQRDFAHLRRGFALRKNDFGKADARFALMIEARETDVFRRPAAQLLEGRIGCEFAAFDRFEKRAQCLRIHNKKTAFILADKVRFAAIDFSR